MRLPMFVLTLLMLLTCWCLAFTPDVKAGARSSCAGTLADCGVPELADDFGCAEPAASCGGRERTILVRWFPGKLLLKGARGVLTPFDGSWRMSPQPRRYGRHRGHGCG